MSLLNLNFKKAVNFILHALSYPVCLYVCLSVSLSCHVL